MGFVVKLKVWGLFCFKSGKVNGESGNKSKENIENIHIDETDFCVTNAFEPNYQKDVV